MDEERQAADRALLERLGHGLDAVVATDARGQTIQWASRQAGDLFDTSPHELVGRRVKELIRNGDTLDEAFASTEARSVPTSIVRSDGAVVPAEALLRPAQDAWIVTLRAMRERTETQEERIRRADEILEVTKLLPDVIFSCYKGPDGKIYWTLNEGRLAQEFHVTTDEIRGKPLEELFPGGASEQIRREFEDAFEGNAKEWVNEMGGRFFKHYPQPVLGPDGKVKRVVGFISEVTNLRKAQDEIKELNDLLAARLQELHTANEELEAFSYTVSHDLRTPLSVVENFVQVLRLKHSEDLGPDGLEIVDKVHAALGRMARLIQDLLSLSRATRQPLVRSRVDVTDVAKAVVEELRTREPRRDVEFSVSPDLTADADPGFLRVVLDNLISNAWKFTRTTAKARVEVGRTPDGAIYVRDNGPGFDAKDAARLFRAFERLEATKRVEGTGIGLATVRRIADRHGGRVWAEASPGKGATFYITFGKEAEA